MELSIRPTTRRDAQLLPDIEESAAQVFHPIPELAWIANDDVMSVETHIEYADAGTSWVAVDGSDHPFGFLCAERIGRDLHIWLLAVRLDSQGQGTGRALLETALAFATDLDLDALTLTTFRSIPWNEPFYARFGFKTLENDSVEDRLAAILQREVEHGLPGKRRCAMRLDVGESQQTIRSCPST